MVHLYLQCVELLPLVERFPFSLHCKWELHSKNGYKNPILIQHIAIVHTIAIVQQIAGVNKPSSPQNSSQSSNQSHTWMHHIGVSWDKLNSYSLPSTKTLSLKFHSWYISQKTSATGGVAKMTDASQYTGSHKERYNFDTFVAFHTRPVLPSK